MYFADHAHPLMMARKDSLFRVSMQECGVSRLISVDFQEDVGIFEAPQAAL